MGKPRFRQAGSGLGPCAGTRDGSLKIGRKEGSAPLFEENLAGPHANGFRQIPVSHDISQVAHVQKLDQWQRDVQRNGRFVTSASWIFGRLIHSRVPAIT